MAILVSKVSGGPDTLGNNWVPTKVGVRIDALRLQNTTPEALEAWFAGLKRLQTDHQVDTADTWNMDEIGTALGVCTNQTVIGSSSTTQSYKKSPDTREWVSIIEAISALAKKCRPLIIFKGKSLQSTWFHHDKTPDWLYTTSV